MRYDFPFFLEDIGPGQVYHRPAGAGERPVAGRLLPVSARVIDVLLFAVKLENDPQLGPGEVRSVASTLAHNRVLGHGGRAARAPSAGTG